MNRAFRMIIVLTLISGFVGSLLAFVYAATWPRIQINERRKLEAAIYKVLPSATGFEEKSLGERTLYQGIDETGAVVGVAFKAEGTGFQGIIKLMAGVTPDYGTMLGLQVLEQIETPGLGARIAEESFREQFRGLRLKDRIAVVKGAGASPENGEIQAITGATISSNAVGSILNTVLAEVRETGGK